MRLLLFISVCLMLASCDDVVKVEHSVGDKLLRYEGVEKAAYAYNAALIAKDTAALNSLLHENVSYGHSNGWIETRAEQIENLYNGTINYHKIEQPDLQVMLNGNVATVRGNGIFDVDYKGTEHMMFDLHVMQTWVYEDGRWQMLNRQSMSNNK